MIPPMQAVIWDLDGTLADTAADLATALNRLLEKYGFERLSNAAVRGMIGDGVTVLIERAFGAVGNPMTHDEAATYTAEFLKLYENCATDETVLFPGIEAVLNIFSAAGLRQGVCTNKPAGISLRILKTLGIRHHFAAVVGGDTTHAKKPDPLPLLTCFAQIGIDPEHGILIGDSHVDAEAAKRAGCRSGLVTYGYAKGSLLNLDADIVADHAEVFLHLATHADVAGSTPPAC